jgi:hypothetical protein
MNDFSIALLGDGVFARWGGECAELNAELTRLYTHSAFDIHNYGTDNCRVGLALHYVTADCNGRKSISYINPTITIVDCCAYSQFWDGPEGLSEYRDVLRRVWDELHKTTDSKLLFNLPAPAPRDRFMENVPAFLNTSKATRNRYADAVKMFIDEARSIAQDEGWPFIDVAAEVEKQVKGGRNARKFFDQNDGVYPSRWGYTAMAKIIVREIDGNRFIEEKISK